MNLSALYNIDFNAWILANVALLKAKQINELDLDNLIEEIEGMSKSEKRELDNRLIELLMHLLKWQYQPQKRTISWRESINKQRVAIETILVYSPSLKYKFEERVDDNYDHAQRYAAVETKILIKNFPDQCPYTLGQILDLDNNFLPTSN